LEERKRRERAQAIGLFRYQLVCPALEEGLSTKPRGKLVREIASRTHADPFGNQVRVSRETLDRWIRRYRGGGFEALVPAPRRLASRTDAQVLELAASLKRENPTRTVAQVVRILRTATGWAPSESTLLRHFHRLDLMGPNADEHPAVFGRFEAADPNELWVGDALHGPRVGDRKTYLFAFLDDHSRLAVGYRFGYAEDTVRLAAALRPALAARGVPRAAYVDNGSAFVDAWLLRACAKLGVSLVHSQPGRPQGRSKIERFFRTVREQFLVEVTDTSNEDLAAAGVDHCAALLELNRLFVAWVETEYHRRTHTETEQPPLARWEAGWDRLGRTPAMPKATLAPQAADALAGEHAERGRNPVLVVDEAHLLDNQQLEAIRLLTNHDMDAGSPFAVVLVGQPTLRHRLRLGVLAALDQRIAVRYQIGRMSTADTADYIRHHCKIAGRSDTLFSDDAIALIHNASRGHPRAVNNLALHALTAAFAADHAIVDEKAARIAIAEIAAD
jgi:transposase InsO family protein